MTVLCANNFIYGMTGGQLAPTTPLGYRTATSKKGSTDKPFNLPSLLWAAGADFVARASVAHPRKLSHILTRALTHKGFRFVEILSVCPTQFGQKSGKGANPSDLMKYIDEIAEYGDLRQEIGKIPQENFYILGELSRYDS